MKKTNVLLVVLLVLAVSLFAKGSTEKASTGPYTVKFPNSQKIVTRI